MSAYEKDINFLKSQIDTRIKMLEIVKENNSYKKKVIFTIISLILLSLLILMIIFTNSKK